MTKTELRKKYKAKRAALSAVAIDQKSMAVANQTLKLPIWNKAVYSLFLSIEKQKEINTAYMLNILHGKDKDITVAKSEFSTCEMTHFLLTDNTKLNVNKWGIPEPVEGIEVPARQIDVVFIPLLAFDHKGNRVGYGKGFYDRFLGSCRQDVIKVGLSFFEAEAQSFSTDKTDIPLDYGVTPDKIYAF